MAARTILPPLPRRAPHPATLRVAGLPLQVGRGLHAPRPRTQNLAQCG